MTTKVTGSVINDLTIASSNIAAGAVIAGKLGAASVSNSNMQANSVGSTNIIDSSVTTTKLLNAAVTPAKLSQPFATVTSTSSITGISKDYLLIPSWVKKISIFFGGVSTNTATTNSVIVQLGTSAGFVTTGYVGTSVFISATTPQPTNSINTGFRFYFGASDTSTASRHGSLDLYNVTSNSWVANGMLGLSDAACTSTVNASIALASVLDRIRITTFNGTDSFDAGFVGIQYS